MSSRAQYVRTMILFVTYWVINWVKIFGLVLLCGPIPVIRALKRYPWLLVFMKINTLMGVLIQGRSGRYQKVTAQVISGVVSDAVYLIKDILRHGDRIVIHEDMIPPELIKSMGLTPFMAEMLGMTLPMIQPDAMEHYIDAAEGEGIPPDICSLPKNTMGLALKGHLPEALAIVTSNLPCDGGMASYSLIKKTVDVPMLYLDIPHNFKGERAEAYFAQELRRLIAWLEEHTPGRMDWERLRTFCRERNRMVELEMEVWDMIRMRPAPMAGEPVYLSHLWHFNVTPGTPGATRAFERLRNATRANLAEGIAAVPNERFRALLWNPPTFHFADIFNWAERVYGVTLIMDSMSFNRLPFIDTTTHEHMLRGIARNIMQGPMARHTRGPVANYLEDIFHIYTHFDLDMIWMAGHIGCKNTQAMNGILREKCREAGIPLLIINYDLSDTRVVSHAGMKEQVHHFMENIMRAERLDGK
jgi:hypothetical protein